MAIENQMARRNATDSQRALYGVKLKEIAAIEAKKRKIEGNRTGGKGGKSKANLPLTSNHQARDDAAAAMNVSPRIGEETS